MIITLYNHEIWVVAIGHNNIGHDGVQLQFAIMHISYARYCYNNIKL